MALAQKYYWPILEHPHDIGGRFSAFTVVGILPCLLLGLSVEKFLKGAKHALEHQQSIEQSIKEMFYHYPYQKIVLLSYSDYTHPLLLWMSQLIAESLGKTDTQGTPKGITPLISRGTCDQHSQLQLWLEGPKDKVFELFFFNDPFDQSKLSVEFHFQSDVLRQLDQHSCNDIFKAHSLSTRKVLENAGYFVKFKEYPCLDEETLGMIMMEKIIEVFYWAHVMQVEPTGQPGVEQSKTYIRSFL